ncbi:universal stress protein [soil metagenome]
MSTLRSILLHLDASHRSTPRLVAACHLAAAHDARVSALYATTPSAMTMPMAAANGTADLFAALQQLDMDRRDNARLLFERTVSTGGYPVRWDELQEASVVRGLTARALCTDLLVFGQYDPADDSAIGTPPDLIESVLIASGKPALILPYVDTRPVIGQDVLIAWKPTRESARAVAGAMPLLKRARRIHLTCDAPEQTEGAGADELEAYLRLHGVQAPLSRRPGLPAESTGDALLSLAADVDADLLVMGCFGHSRAREFVLGGASRTVLRSMTVPVLMAH